MIGRERGRPLRGPLFIGLSYAITLVLALPPLAERWNELAGSLSAAGVLAGLLGLTGFAVNIILGARLPLSPRLLGGMDRLYSLHRLNGRLVYLLVLAHVILIVGSRGVDSVDAALRLFTSGAGYVVALGLIAFVGLTAAIAATLYARLTHETFVYVQRSFGLVFIAGALHAFMTDGAKAASDPLTVYLGVTALAAAAAFGYRSMFANLLVRRYDYTVAAVRRLDRSVVEIEMEPLDRHLVARPGQFVFVTFYSDSFDARFHPVSISSQGESAVIVLRPGDVRDQYHPFSLTSTPTDEHLSLVIKAVGDFTRALPALGSGARARVEGPYGEFSHLNMRSRRQIWIAGGIGITPFLSMARSLDENGFEITLFWGVHDRTQAYFAEELNAVAERFPHFDFHLVPEDEVGFISADSVREQVDTDGVDVLIVGPPAMERSLRGQFAKAGVPEARIHSERFAFGSPRTR
jgi:predicted ferric reductase